MQAVGGGWKEVGEAIMKEVGGGGGCCGSCEYLLFLLYFLLLLLLACWQVRYGTRRIKRTVVKTSLGAKGGVAEGVAEGGLSSLSCANGIFFYSFFFGLYTMSVPPWEVFVFVFFCLRCLRILHNFFFFFVLFVVLFFFLFVCCFLSLRRGCCCCFFFSTIPERDVQRPSCFFLPALQLP